MKKLFVLFAAATLFVGVQACGSAGGDSSEATTEEVTTDETATEETVTEETAPAETPTDSTGATAEAPAQ
jgi:hypothetical protein